MFASPFLEGDRVMLMPLQPSDGLWLQPIWNDPETTKWMVAGRTPMAREEMDQLIASWRSPSAFVFGLSPVKERATRVGYAGLFAVDWIDRKAEFRIMVSAKTHGIGIGRQATSLMLRFAFSRLNLNRVWLGTAATNDRALACFAKCGFREEGRLLKDLWRDGSYIDNVRMAILQAEFKGA